ncbi:hypothetical protein Tsubulata_021600 [Turnera subulata]|uniref:Polymerase nucleotidyl transferase domain-containing protein n=1 Tax=Turnera subulata TaxID=218843 RepID=A0A9Q0G568_9ROSI|nr:hypothetical protein Tsubulata_021600 [Turnera subulata]
MGGFEGPAQSSGFFPNGLLPNEVASVTRELEPERWALAETRTAELISCIQPNQPSEERRNAVASYVQRLIAKCFSCQVFTFGSVPLKTYLPDGDIDLTAFSQNQNLKDNWANEVRDILEHEEKSENAEFRVKEVQYIQAEVKIIKCLVENIVVDISFNQLGGLCTLCFLEEVDRLIDQNHLFKRSIILIKAWCYYESRILGAHHGLISTYALETLVLYIFHVFNSSFAGPLEVLYRFLEFFSKFDWENYCISLWGPVPISSLPDMTAYPPRKDGGELLLSKLFLDACGAVYAVYPVRQENQEQAFISKYFNVIDPLRTNNNLGRSVSKGNFFRIRSAFAFGAQRLARLLDCPKEDLLAELNQFFLNTWERHGKGHRPDAPSLNHFGLQPINSNHTNGNETLRNHSSSRKTREDAETQTTHAGHAFAGVSSHHGNYSLKQASRAIDMAPVSHISSQKTPANVSTPKVSHQSSQTHQSLKSTSSNENIQNEKGRGSKTENLGNEAHARYRFARTHSSPELKDTLIDIQPRGRNSRVLDAGNGQIASARSDSRMKNLSPEVLENHSARFSNESSSKLSSSHQSIDCGFDSNTSVNSVNGDSGGAAMEDHHSFLSEKMQIHQEDQDRMNMMASHRGYGLGGQDQMSGNLTPGHHIFSMPPHMFIQKNLSGAIPMHVPFESQWALNMHYPQGVVPLPVAQYFPNMGMTSSKEERDEVVNESAEPIEDDIDHGFWSKQGANAVRYDHRNSSAAQLQDDAQQFHSVESNHIHPPRISSTATGRLPSRDRGLTSEDRDPIQENYGGKAHYQRTRYADAYSSSSFRYAPASQASSSGSKMSSEDSWDGSPLKTSKSTRSRRGKISSSSAEPSVSDGIGMNGWQYEKESVDLMSSQADNENREWIPLSTVGSKMTETVVSADASSHVRTHKMPGYELASGSGPNSMLPVAPVLVGSESQQRPHDNHGALSYAFYPTGPPVPFLAMLPVYNLPNEKETSSVQRNKSNRDEDDNFHYNQSGHNFDVTESLDQSEIMDSTSMKNSSFLGPAEQRRADILNGDFASHWQNLQYGRFCQTAQHNGQLIHPPSVVPPMYLPGHFPWDSPVRPAANMNIVSQLMNNGPHLVPVPPLSNASSMPTGIRQHYTEEFPRYRGGTGTYLPNPIAVRDRQPSNVRNHRGNFGNDRKDHYGDREGNWNNSKPRFGNRSQYNQAERSSMRIERSAANNRRSDRPWNSKQDSFPQYYSRNSSLNVSNSTNRNSPGMAYGMYPLPVVNANGVSPSGASVPSVVMFYPYDHNIGYGSSSEHLEFGSFGSVHVPSRPINEQQDIRGDSDFSSPDQPSSP